MFATVIERMKEKEGLKTATLILKWLPPFSNDNIIYYLSELNIIFDKQPG